MATFTGYQRPSRGELRSCRRCPGQIQRVVQGVTIKYVETVPNYYI